MSVYVRLWGSTHAAEAQRRRGAEKNSTVAQPKSCCTRHVSSAPLRLWVSAIGGTTGAYPGFSAELGMQS